MGVRAMRNGVHGGGSLEVLLDNGKISCVAIFGVFPKSRYRIDKSQLFESRTIH
jgi:hypothetical protein